MNKTVFQVVLVTATAILYFISIPNNIHGEYFLAPPLISELKESDIQFDKPESLLTNISHEDKIDFGAKLLEILIQLSGPTFQDFYSEHKLQIAKTLAKKIISDQFSDIINFTLSDMTKEEKDSSKKIHFENFLKSKAIVNDIIRQMALLGRIQPGDKFVVSKKMSKQEMLVNGRKNHIDSQTPLNDHLDRISGEVEYYKYNGNNDIFIILRLNLLEQNNHKLLFISDITRGLPEPQDKCFVSVQALPTNLSEVAKIFSSNDKFSLIDILGKFGYRAPDTESFQFERSSFFTEIDGYCKAYKPDQTNYLLSDSEGIINSTGLLIGDKADEKEQTDQRSNSADILHHVHPNNNYWLSGDDVLSSMALGVPCAITGENGEGLYYSPKFSRIKEDELQRIFKRFYNRFATIMILLAHDKHHKELRNQFALAFLSHFFEISRYKIPNTYSKPIINAIRKGNTRFFETAA